MGREPGLWSKVTRIKTGGIQMYVPKEVVDRALESAGVNPSLLGLVRKVTWLKSSRVGRARIMVELEAVVDVRPSLGVQGKGIEKVI